MSEKSAASVTKSVVILLQLVILKRQTDFLVSTEDFTFVSCQLSSITTPQAESMRSVHFDCFYGGGIKDAWSLGSRVNL